MKLTTRYGNGEKLITNIFRAALPVVLYLMLTTAVMILASSVSSFIFLKNGITTITDEMIQDFSLPVTGISAAISIPIFLWMQKRGDSRRELTRYAIIANVSIEESLELQNYTEPTYRDVPFVKYIWIGITGIALAFAFNVIVNFIGTGSSGTEYNETVGTIFELPFIVQVLISVLLVPAAEELVFRGVMYKQLREWLLAVPAAIVCALTFGIYHWNLIQGIYAFFMGMLFCLCADKYHTVWAAVLCHALANLMLIVATETDLIYYLVYKNNLLGYVISAVLLMIGAMGVYKIFKISDTHTSRP